MEDSPLSPSDSPSTPVVIDETKPWEKLAWPKTGDTDRSKTFAAVGASLTEWARYEASLGRLFVAFVTLDRDSDAARRAFEAVRTYEGRDSMIRAVAETYFMSFPYKEAEAAFKRLMKLSKLLSERRNEIAHGAVQPFMVETFPTPTISGFCLMPSNYDFKKSDVHGWPKHAYNSLGIYHYCMQFSELTQPTQAIAEHVVRHAVAWRKSGLWRPTE